MATATAAITNRNCCFVCGKAKSTYRCAGCLKEYCKNHLQDHQKELELQLDEIENERNIFRQLLSEQIEQPNKQQLIQQINQWEQCSIKGIQQTAEENRKLIFEQTNKHFKTIEVDLKCLTDEIKEARQENDFNELTLNELRNQLDKLQKQLNNPANISLKEDNTLAFINRIYVDTEYHMSNISMTSKWKQNAITIAGGNGQGSELNQLDRPWSILIDDEKTIYVADTYNHRIVAWKNGTTCGQIIAGGNGQGNGNHQLSYPTKLIIDKVNNSLIIADFGNKRVVRWPRYNGARGEIIIQDVKCVDLVMYRNEYLYVSDEDKHEVRRWKIGESQGVLVAGGNGCGDHLNQFNQSHCMHIDQNETLYVSDYRNHRVMKWTKGAKEGIIVVGEHGQGTSLKQLSYPQGIFVDRLNSLYIADASNNRIMRWTKDANEGSIIAGGNGKGNEPNQFGYPIGLLFDDENNFYVVDHHNHRIQKFLIDN